MSKVRLSCLLALAIAVTLLLAATAPATAGTVGPAGAFTFRFEPLEPSARAGAPGRALVDFGVVAAQPGNNGLRGAIVIRRRIAVRLDGPPGSPSSARVSVALGTQVPGCTVRVDGITLTTVPRMLNPMHRTRTPVVHEIEVTIPAHVPPGAFASDLQWLAESD